MIKLYNNSKIKDEVIKPILKDAYKALRLKGDIIVLVTKGKNGGGHWGAGNLFRDTRFNNGFKWVSSSLGKITINPFLVLWNRDPLHNAGHIYETIQHEFKHAFDWYMTNMRFDSKKVPYINRNYEINARCYVRFDAKKDEELLLNLAIEIERINCK